jgi:hypothetical protein
MSCVGLERVADAMAPSLLDVETILRWGHHRRRRRRGLAIACVAVLGVVAGLMLPALSGSRSVVLDEGAEDPAGTGAASPGQPDRYTHTLTALDGGEVSIEAPVRLEVDGATIIATVVFDSAVLEFTAGGPSLAEFVRSWEGLVLESPSPMPGEGRLSVGRGGGAGAVALWEGEFFSLLTASDSLDVPGLRAHVEGLRMVEGPRGVVLDLGAAGRFDRGHPVTLHQPVPGVGGLEVQPLSPSTPTDPDPSPEQMIGGSLYEEDDGSLVLVGTTAVAGLMPFPGTPADAARDLMEALRVSWQQPQREALTRPSTPRAHLGAAE